MQKTTKCIICENQSLRRYKGEVLPFLKDRMFNDPNIESDFLYCPNCHVSFSEVRPSDEEAGRYYQNYMQDEYLEHRKKHEGQFIAEYSVFLKEIAEFGNALKRKVCGEILERNIDLSKVLNVLDFGGGNGSMLPEKLEHAQKFVYDIDNSPTVEGVKKITKEEIGNYSWDIIFCGEVLEHVSYPMDIIKEILEILPEGKYLCIDVPFEGKAHNSYVDDKQEPLHIHEHINKFRPITLEKMFNSFEYLVLENEMHTFYPPEIVYSEGISICLIRKLRKDEDVALLKNIYSVKNKLTEMERKFENFEKTFIHQNWSNSIERVDNEFFDKTTFLQQVFSVRNEGKHKVLRILGFKIKMKRENK